MELKSYHIDNIYDILLSFGKDSINEQAFEILHYLYNEIEKDEENKQSDALKKIGK